MEANHNAIHLPNSNLKYTNIAPQPAQRQENCNWLLFVQVELCADIYTAAAILIADKPRTGIPHWATSEPALCAAN